MKFSEVITEFKIDRRKSAENFFSAIKFSEIGEVVRARVIHTTIDCEVRTFFPELERGMAVWAEPFRFMMRGEVHLGERFADFAFNLGSFFPIVKIEVRMRSAAVSADNVGRHSGI